MDTNHAINQRIAERLASAPAALGCDSRRRVCSRRGQSRRGITMLELVIAGSMLAMVVTSLSVVMRTSREAWDIAENDYGKLHQGHSVVRHFVRAAREAKQVESISSKGDLIQMTLGDGTSTQWAFRSNGANGLRGVIVVVDVGRGTEAVLAHDITNVQFVGYKADGKTVTTVPREIRLVGVTVRVDLPRDYQSYRDITSKVWIRSW